MTLPHPTALRRHVLALVPAGATALESPYPDDGLVRGTVFREPYFDVFGREVYTAVDANARRISEGVATPEERDGVIARLWNDVDAVVRALRPVNLVRE